MSGPLAIAATTHTLREMLRAGMTALDIDDALGGDVVVNVAAPDTVPRTGQNAPSLLNVFLFNVTRNTGYATDALASRNGRGDPTANPVLGLDLHYLLSAFGASDYHAEMLLGGAMQVLHDTPALGRETIRDALSPATHPTLPPQLQDAGLADQFEYLKISPLPMPSEEISRIWASIQAPYRASAAYLVSVLLLQSRRTTHSVLPVSDRAFHVVPYRDLRIDRVLAADGPQVPITANSTLRILGRNLAANNISVWVNSIDVTSGVISRAADEIRVSLLLPPGPALPPGLHAGIGGVQLVQPIDMGDPPVPHEGFASNVATFTLVPEIAPVTAVNRIDVACVPPIGAAQRVRLLLNQSDAAPGAVPRAYSFPAPPGNGVVPPATETSMVSIPIANVTHGSYLVRLQVDGAQSVPSIGIGGRYDQPEVML